MSWIHVELMDGTVLFINSLQVTQVVALDDHSTEITLADGTQHNLSMTCAEFMGILGCGFGHEHNP